MTKRWSRGLVALFASMVLAGCGNNAGTDSNNSDGKVTISTTTDGELASLDHTQSTDNPSLNTISNVMEGLYRPADDQSIELGVAAEEPEISDDQLTYTFKIRDDANWSNGDPVTAQDFVYTYQKSVNPESLAANIERLLVMKNARAISEGDMSPDELGVRAIDDKTLEIQLEYPIAYFKELLAAPYYLPQNEKVAEKKGDSYGNSAENAVYNGPYELTEWNGSDIEWTMTKNDDYWDKDNVQIDDVHWIMSKENSTNANLFNEGEVQYTAITTPFVEQYEGDDNLQISPKGMVGYLEFNSEREPTNNVHFRRAISQAYDRQAFVDTILKDGSQPVGGWIPHDYANHPETDKDFRDDNGDLMPFDPEAAQKEWDKALDELGKDSIEIEILTSDTETSKATSEFLQAQLQDNLPGLTVTIRNVPLKSRQGITGSGEFDIVYGTYAPSYKDPSAFLNFYVSSSNMSSGGFSDTTYDQMISDAETNYIDDPVGRWNALKDAEKYLVQDQAPVSPIYQGSFANLVDPKLKNVTNQPNGVSQYFRTAEYK